MPKLLHVACCMFILMSYTCVMERLMYTDFIHADPKIMLGKPVIRGTRITVEHILESLAAGETIEQLLEGHPRLTREAILAALEFAAATLRSEVVYPADKVA